MHHAAPRRRTLLALPLAAWPGVPALAQPAPRPGRAAPRVVTLSPGATRTMPAFRAALAELGYPIELEVITTVLDGPQAAAAMAGASVVVAISPPAIAAARRLARSVPVVALDLEMDPVASGLVETLARPGGNLTGLFLDQPGIAAKWLQLLAEAVPTLRRLAVLWDPATGPTQRDAVRAAAQAQGMQVETFELRAEGFEAAFARIGAMRAEGLVLLSSPLVFQGQERLVQLTSAARLPSITMFTDFVAAGGFLAYGPDRADMGRRAAAYVDHIIKGRRPAELPVERPSRFELAINLRTAKALDISVPPALLARADAVLD